GNSVYFPDRVVPMLPEALSNGLCSLVPGEDRACVAVHLWIDGDGRKTRHRFERAVMRSAARLTYEAVQAARQGAGAVALAPERLAALYGAFAALDRAGARSGRASGGARRGAPAGGDRAAATPRQPPADRGVHGARQCRRRRGAG